MKFAIAGLVLGIMVWVLSGYAFPHQVQAADANDLAPSGRAHAAAGLVSSGEGGGGGSATNEITAPIHGERATPAFGALSSQARSTFVRLLDYTVQQKRVQAAPELTCAFESCTISDFAEAKILALNAAGERWGDRSLNVVAALPVVDGEGNIFSVLVVASTDPEDNELEAAAARFSSNASSLQTTRERAAYASGRFRTIYVSVTLDRPPVELAWKGLPRWMLQFEEVLSGPIGAHPGIHAVAEVARANDSQQTCVLLAGKDPADMFLWDPYKRRTMADQKRWRFTSPHSTPPDTAKEDRIRESWRRLRAETTPE